ncbi:MAG: T9SS type A sorting domain-containing protein [Bacteroidales bacterium]|nr:T9SS type A sorting domain-containing protein [Bacteroidales bacterium]
MRSFITVFLITFCFSVNSQSQSIFELSEDISFYSSFSNLTIENVKDTSMVLNNGAINNYKNYVIVGSDSYNYYRFIEKNKGSGSTFYNIESIPEHRDVPNKPQRNTDTLFIVLDQDYGWFMNVYIDREINYSGVAVPTWISPTLGYRILDHGTLNIVAILPMDGADNLVFRENIEFNGQDTVFLSSSEAIHLINFEPVDQNGTPLEDLNMGGQDVNKYSLVFDLANGGVATINIEIGFFDLITSDYHGAIYMCFGSMYRDGESGHPNYFIEYPIQNSITQPIILANEPENLASAVLNYTFFDKRDYNKIGLGSFQKFLSPITGKPTIWGGIHYSQNPPDPFWETTLYMDMQESDKLGYCTQHRMKYVENGNDYPYIHSPYFDEHNDSIAGFYGFTPDEDVHYINDYDTLFFGIGSSYYWPIWAVSHSCIYCISDNMGLFGNYFYQDYITDTYKIIDDTGNIIHEGTGLEMQSGYIEPGIYTVELINSFCPFNSYVGTSSVIVSVNTTNTDGDPPPVSQIQLLNADNTMKYHFESDKDVLLKFSASDFIGYNNHHVGIGFQPVVDSRTSVSIKLHDQTDWSDVDCQKIYCDSIIGSQYQAELSDYLISDSAMYDLKIYVEDYSGNSSEYLFSPAFIYGNFIVGIPDKPGNNEFDEQILFTPNPARDKISVSNIEAYKDAFLTYEILNMNGLIVKKGELSKNTSSASVNISNLSDGLYIIVLRNENKPLIVSKIIKMQ